MDALGVPGQGPAGLRPATDIGGQSPSPACHGSAETHAVALDEATTQYRQQRP